MVYNISLVIVCILQLFAAVTAISLVRWTKYNVSWILICAGLVTLSIRSVCDIVGLFVPEFGFKNPMTYSWGGIFVSLCFAIGVFLIKKIFIYIRVADVQQRTFEKRLLKSVLQAEENERKRFATELHDGLGPLLSSIKMGFSAIKTDIKDEEVRNNLEYAIAEAITTVREVSNNLSPHVLNSFGLEKAIKNFINTLTLPSSFKISYNMQLGDKRYSQTKEIVVYRVFCELLTNTLRHAEATEVDFELLEENKELVLRFHDNGIGFDPERENLKGSGYYNIISRVSSLKGQTTFRRGEEANNERGTFVEVRIP